MGTTIDSDTELAQSYCVAAEFVRYDNARRTLTGDYLGNNVFYSPRVTLALIQKTKDFAIATNSAPEPMFFATNRDITTSSAWHLSLGALRFARMRLAIRALNFPTQAQIVS